MTEIEPIGYTEYTAHKEREVLRLKINEIIEALNGISVNDAKITLKQGSALRGEFTLNQAEDKTIVLDSSIAGFVWGEGSGTITDQTDLVNYIANQIEAEALIRSNSDDALTLAISGLDDAVVKKTSIATAFGVTPSDEKVPSEKLVNDALIKKEAIATAFGVTPSDEKVPSEKLVYDNTNRIISNEATAVSPLPIGVTALNIQSRRIGRLIYVVAIITTSGAINETKIANAPVGLYTGGESLIVQAGRVKGRLSVQSDGIHLIAFEAINNLDTRLSYLLSE